MVITGIKKLNSRSVFRSVPGRYKSLVTVGCFIICNNGIVTSRGCCVGILFSGGAKEGGPLTAPVLCQQPECDVHSAASSPTFQT